MMKKKFKYLFYVSVPILLAGCSSQTSGVNPFTLSSPEEIAYNYLFINKGNLYSEFTPAVLTTIVGVSLARIGYKMFFPQANLGNDRGISLETFFLMILKIVLAIAFWFVLPRIVAYFMGIQLDPQGLPVKS